MENIFSKQKNTTLLLPAGEIKSETFLLRGLSFTMSTLAIKMKNRFICIFLRFDGYIVCDVNLKNMLFSSIVIQNKLLID